MSSHMLTLDIFNKVTMMERCMIAMDDSDQRLILSTEHH